MAAMTDKPTISDLRAAVGISQSYASMILSGDRQPSLPLAIRMFRETGWRHGVLAPLSETEIDVLERVTALTPDKAA